MIHRILYFMDNYRSLGGAANTLLRQTILMRHIGKNVIVAVSRYGINQVCEDYLTICARENIPIYEQKFSVANQPEGVSLFSILENYDEIKAFIEFQKPDIVHSVQLNPTVELVCRELKIPHVMNIYQALPEFFVFRYPDIFARFHICDSLCYAAFWQKYVKTKSYCVRTMAQRGKKREKDDFAENLRFVCVGQLCERKNQLEVIKAFSLAVNRGLKGILKIWGHADSSYADKCQKYISDHMLGNYISIKGFSQDLENIYQECDALICGSISESYPNVISEALANEVVVITTPVAGVPEIIRDRENGYLCKGYSAECIADKIMVFEKDMRTGAIKEIWSHADDTYASVHSPKVVTESLIKTYEAILSEYRQESCPLYTIENLKEEFRETIDCFWKYRDKFTDEAFIKMNLWKIHFVVLCLKRKELNKNQGFYIWGTGKLGGYYKEIVEIFAPDIRISGFIDSYKTGDYMGYQIVPPEDILKGSKKTILIGVFRAEGIIETLRKSDYRYGTDYFKFEQIPW